MPKPLVKNASSFIDYGQYFEKTKLLKELDAKRLAMKVDGPKFETQLKHLVTATKAKDTVLNYAIKTPNPQQVMRALKVMVALAEDSNRELGKVKVSPEIKHMAEHGIKTPMPKPSLKVSNSEREENEQKLPPAKSIKRGF